MKLKLTTLAIAIHVLANAQTPTGTAPPATIFPPNLPTVKGYAERAWYRGGNFPGGIAGANNIFGTMWNSAIYTHTNNKNRMIVN